MSGNFSIKKYDTQGAYSPAQSQQANTKAGQAKNRQMDWYYLNKVMEKLTILNLKKH